MSISATRGSPHTVYQVLCEELRQQPRTWLVTGAAGFIGSGLTEALLGLGQRVVALDDFSTGTQANIDDALAVADRAAAGSRDRFRLIRGDIRDAAACRAACDRVDIVLHQAAVPSVPRSIDDPVTSNAVNVEGTLHLFLAARDAGVNRIVFASSCAVYGDTPETPIAEGCPWRPLSPYAATKAADELYATAFHRSYGSRITALRYFNVYGRRQDPTGAYAGVIPLWVTALLDGRPCRIFGDGETSRDFVHVSDVVQANLLAATASTSAPDGDVYNVASGHSTSLNELFRVVRDAVAARRPATSGATPSYEPFRAGDIRHSSAKVDRARQFLRFEPLHRLETGIGEAIDWYVGQSDGHGSR